MAIRTRPQTDDDQSLGSLLGEASSEFGALISKEIELAKLELKEEVTVAVNSGKFFSIAAFCGYLAALLLSFAAAWGLSEVMPAGFAFLIIGALYAVIAAAAFATGRKQFREFNLVPKNTVETLKEDVQWLKARKTSS